MFQTKAAMNAALASGNELQKRRLMEKRKRTFEIWMGKVDAHIAKRCMGFTSEDIDDYCYWEAFADGVSPSDCAKAAIRNAREAMGYV